MNQSVTVLVRRNVKCIMGSQILPNLCPKHRRYLMYITRNFYNVIRERILLTCGTICDMKCIDMLSISDQSYHIIIMIHMCVANLQNAKHYSSFVCLCRGNLDVFKMIVSISGQNNAP